LRALHAASFSRGWSETEFEQLLTDRSVIADRALWRAQCRLHRLASCADEAENLSVAVARALARRGLARRLLDLHFAGLRACGCGPCFLEVGRGQRLGTAALRARDSVKSAAAGLLFGRERARWCCAGTLCRRKSAG
jgi:ribosomal-protein-alanine N-acetyltransferase